MVTAIKKFTFERINIDYFKDDNHITFFFNFILNPSVIPVDKK